MGIFDIFRRKTGNLEGNGGDSGEPPESGPDNEGEILYANAGGGMLNTKSGLALNFELSECRGFEPAAGNQVAIDRTEGMQAFGLTLIAQKREPNLAVMLDQATLSPKEVAERKKRAEASRRKQVKLETKRRETWWKENRKKTVDDLRAELAEKIATSPLAPRREMLMKLAMPTVRLNAVLGSPSNHLVSRFGGKPSLPADVAWPQGPKGPLAFLAQLRLNEISSTITSPVPLPDNGTLLFFYDAIDQVWGFEPEDAESWSVLFFDSDRELEVRDWPDDLAEEARFPQCVVRVGRAVTLPSPFADEADEFVNTDEDNDGYWDLLDTARGLEHSIPEHAVGGWPSIVQHPMEGQCQLVSQGVRMGNEDEYEETYTEGMEDGAEDWRLLLQIASDEEGPDWLWGDLGFLYFWIREQDLLRRDFSKVWMILQCT